MTPAERKQLKQNLVMFAKAHKYLEKKGLIGAYMDSTYQLSSAVFNELFDGQFKKKKSFNPEYNEHSITVDGHTFMALFQKE